jgi:hypothetical protein
VHGAVGDYPVDDSRALEHRRLVEAAGVDELPRAARSGSLGHPLRAAGAWGQSDDRLHEPELRRLLGPDQVAAERDLEPGGEAEAVD